MKTAILVVGLCLALSGMTRAQDADCRFAPGSRKGHVRLDRHSPEPGFDPAEVVRRVQAQREPEPRHKRTRRPSAEGPELWTDAGEFLIDTSIVYAPAPYDQRIPAVAFDGTHFLVVWQDSRSGDWDVFGARVSRSGVVLDSAGIPISTATRDQSFPAVAFDGANFLVVWEDWRSGSGDIYGARVSPDGMVFDPAGIAISTAADDQRSPAVAFDGTNFFVVWEDRRRKCDIYGARVSPGGVVLDPAGIAVAPTTGWKGSPAVAFDGTNYLVVWLDSRSDCDIYGARVSPGGVVLDPAGIPIATAAGHQMSPAVAFDGTNYLVIWEDLRGGDYPDIYGARVSLGGVVLDPAGIAVSTAADGQWSPAVAFDGTNFLVVWEDLRGARDYGIYGARVSPGGVVLDPAGIAISTAAYAQESPAVAFDGTNFLVVWDERSGDYGIFGVRVSPGGVVLDPAGIAISTAAYAQESPAVAFDGTNYLVVWQDRRSGSSDIYGARVSLGGVVLDPAGIAVSTAADGQWSPAVAFDGTNFLVVWEDYRGGDSDIFGARVSPGGVVLDPAGIAVATVANWHRSPAVAYDGTNFFVVWSDGRNGADIYGARVSRAGVVLDSGGIAVSTATNRQDRPAVTFDGTSYLVVWADLRGGWDYDIYGARVSPGGVVLDPAGIKIAAWSGRKWLPAVASNGTLCAGSNEACFLVVWGDHGSAGWDIRGARVSPGGVVLDPAGIRISTATGSQRFPAVAFEGTSYLVVWADLRGGWDYDIYGARVSLRGTVYNQGPVVRQEGNQSYPALARGADSRMALVYQGWAGTVGGKTYNTQRIWGKMDPSPGVEERDPEPTGRRQGAGATIVRGVLNLTGLGHNPDSPGGIGLCPALLLDISGRKVMELQPGENDIRHLSPGVYFVRTALWERSPDPPAAARAGRDFVRKVVIQR